LHGIINPLGKRPAPWKGLPGAGDLLKIANRLRNSARKAEDIATWMGKALNVGVSQSKNVEEGEDIVLGGTLYEVVKVAQAERDAGMIAADEAFCILYRVAARMADVVIERDPKIQELSKKVEAIAKREGREEDETCGRQR